MRKAKKIVIVATLLFAIVFIASFTVNLALNKKYAVDEIGYTDTNKGLFGVQEIIESDYLVMMYLNVFFTVFLLALMVIVILMKKQK